MTLENIYTILTGTGFPIAYSHFTKTPTIPFITYLTAYSSNFNADNKVYSKIDNLQIELYTIKKDTAVEKVLEDILDNNDITYDTTETFINEENLFQRIYEVRLI